MSLLTLRESLTKFFSNKANVGGTAVCLGCAYKLSTEKEYSDWARSYTSTIPAWLFDYTHKERKKLLLTGMSGRIMEIGSSHGYNFNYFPENIEWQGIDKNPDLSAHAKDVAASNGFPAGTLLLEEGDIIEKLKRRKGGTIDVVLSTRTLCCLPEDQISLALVQIQRVLRPGGRLIFVEPTAASTFSPSRLLQFMFSPIVYLLDGSSYHKDIIKPLQTAGFKQVYMESWPSFTPNPQVPLPGQTLSAEEIAEQKNIIRQGVQLVSWDAENASIKSSLQCNWGECVIAGICFKDGGYKKSSLAGIIKRG